MEQIIVNFAVYEDSQEFLGLADATLPEISWMSAALSGAGIGGSVDIVAPGMMDAMEMSLSFNTFTNASAALAEPRVHHIDLRGAREDENIADGTILIAPIKHILRVIPKNFNPGNLAPVTTSGGSGTYAVQYWKCEVDGKTAWELDPLNYICVVNGNDYLAGVRSALGR